MADIKGLVRSINNQFGDKVVIRLASDIEDPFSDRLPTGSLMLDCITGGGLPKGGLSQYIGLESAGKTSMAFKTIAAIQQMYPDAKIVYAAIEHEFDRMWAEKLGVDTNKLIVLRAEGGESYLDSIKSIVDSNEYTLVAIDSIPALVTLDEVSRELSDSAKMGEKARLISRFVSRCIWGAKKTEEGESNKTCVLAINQYQFKIGGYSPHPGMIPKEAKGGQTLRYAKLLDVEFVSGQRVTEGTGESKVEYGKQIKFRVIKGKVGCPEGGVGSVDFYHRDYGNIKSGQIDIGKEYRICGIRYGIIVRKGRYFKYLDKDYEKAELENLITTDLKFKNKLRSEIIEASKTSPVFSEEEGEKS